MASPYFCSSPDIVTGPSSLLFLPLPQWHGVFSFPSAAVDFPQCTISPSVCCPFPYRLKFSFPGENVVRGVQVESWGHPSAAPSSFIIHPSSFSSSQFPLHIWTLSQDSFESFLQVFSRFVEKNPEKTVQYLVAQACPTLCNFMDCSQPGSSVHGNSPGRNTGVGGHALLQGIFPTQGPNPGLPQCRQKFYCLSHQGNPRILEQVAYPSPGDLPDSGMEPGSPVLQADSLSAELPGKRLQVHPISVATRAQNSLTCTSLASTNSLFPQWRYSSQCPLVSIASKLVRTSGLSLSWSLSPQMLGQVVTL